MIFIFWLAQEILSWCPPTPPQLSAAAKMSIFDGGIRLETKIPHKVQCEVRLVWEGSLVVLNYDSS